MKLFRFPALALVAASLLVIAWSISAGGCSQKELIAYNCFQPSEGEYGADGGPDLCHCNVPPPYADNSCPCTSGDIVAEGLTGIQIFHDCMSLVTGTGGEAGDDADAGDDAEGGPLPECNGACWPPPPHDWMDPLLLWRGDAGDMPQCPTAAPWVYYNGYAGDTFALGCTGAPSGARPIPGEVCAPAFLDGFSQCVVRDGVVPCPTVGGTMLGEYTAEYVFYEIPGQPLVPSTFCCLAARPPS
jgi:hypothetical protein